MGSSKKDLGGGSGDDAKNDGGKPNLEGQSVADIMKFISVNMNKAI